MSRMIFSSVNKILSREQYLLVLLRLETPINKIFCFFSVGSVARSVNMAGKS